MQIECIYGDANHFKKGLEEALQNGYKIIQISSSPVQIGANNNYSMMGFFSAVLQKDE